MASDERSESVQGRVFDEDGQEVFRYDPDGCPGYLLKEGGRYQSWKRRFFLIHGDQMVYFKDAKKAELYVFPEREAVHTMFHDRVRKSMQQGFIWLPFSSVYKGRFAAAARALSKCKAGDAEGYFEIITCERRFRMLANSKHTRLLWERQLKKAFNVHEKWSKHIMQYDAKRHDVLEEPLFVQVKKKRKSYLGLCTRYFLQMYRNETKGIPEFWISLFNCQMVVRKDTREIEICTPDNRVVFLEFDEEPLFQKWTTFLRESIFLASCAQMVSVSGDIAEEEERLLLELAHTPSQRDIRMKRKSILLEGGLHMGNHDLESTVGTSTAIGGYQDADADRTEIINEESFYEFSRPSSPGQNSFGSEGDLETSSRNAMYASGGGGVGGFQLFSGKGAPSNSGGPSSSGGVVSGSGVGSHIAGGGAQGATSASAQQAVRGGIFTAGPRSNAAIGAAGADVVSGGALSGHPSSGSDSPSSAQRNGLQSGDSSLLSGNGTDRFVGGPAATGGGGGGVGGLAFGGGAGAASGGGAHGVAFGGGTSGAALVGGGAGVVASGGAVGGGTLGGAAHGGARGGDYSSGNTGGHAAHMQAGEGQAAFTGGYAAGRGPQGGSRPGQGTSSRGTPTQGNGGYALSGGGAYGEGDSTDMDTQQSEGRGGGFAAGTNGGLSSSTSSSSSSSTRGNGGLSTMSTATLSSSGGPHHPGGLTQEQLGRLQAHDPRRRPVPPLKSLSRGGSAGGEGNKFFPEHSSGNPLGLSSEISQEEENNRLDEAVAAMSNGFMFIKHGRQGRPHARFVFLDLNHECIRWSKVSNRKKVSGNIAIEDLCQVTLGLNSKVLKRTGVAGRDPYYFSIHSIDRSLDLECQTPNETRYWSQVFQLLVHVSLGNLSFADLDGDNPHSLTRTLRSGRRSNVSSTSFPAPEAMSSPRSSSTASVSAGSNISQKGSSAKITSFSVTK